MVKRIVQTLSATWFMGSLMIILASVMAVATFIENDYGTHAAKALVYNTWWFELIFFLLAVNMVGNIINYHLWHIGKISVLLFHISFLIIITGAAITRYVGFEGLLHIREGERENVMLSLDPYVMVEFRVGEQGTRTDQLAFLSPVSPHQFRATMKAGQERVRIRSVAFIPNAIPQPVETSDGKPLVAIVFSDGRDREEHFLQSGEIIQRSGFSVGFEPKNPEGIDIIIGRDAGDHSLKLMSNHTFSGLNMEGGEPVALETAIPYPFQPGLLYDFDEFRLTVSQYYPSAQLLPLTIPGSQGSGLPNAVVFEVNHKDRIDQLVAYGRHGRIGEPFILDLNGAELSVRFGSRSYELPFFIHLNRFVLERYPGSESPSGYMSELTLMDEDEDVEFSTSVFMNNVLDYRGYRLFQSSYDQDEKGTVLSVNHDRWGTVITYFGYFLMSLSMMWALFARKTRFRSLIKAVDKIHQQRKKILLVLLCLLPGGMLVSQNHGELPPAPDKEISAAFGGVWVQDNGGRIKPLNSLHQEIALKLVKHQTFRGMTADQMVLGMLTHPAQWQTFPLITVKDPQVKTILGVAGNKAAFADFFDSSRHYKLHQWVDAAHRKNPASRNKLEQELIKIDEQVNVFYLTQMGSLHRMFPSPKDLQTPWYTPTSQPATLSHEDSLFVTSSMRRFITYVRNQDTSGALEQLKLIDKYQNHHSEEILPTERMRNLELLYNRLSIFLWLATWFFGLGVLLVILQFIGLMVPALNLKRIMQIGIILLLLGFLYHTFGLILRWIIAGHAPWSNGYESMIFVAWAVLFAGFIMARKSNAVLPVTGLFAGVVLMVAHLSWMNPHITNLVPVLQSYWLTLHVSVIIGGYGFLALGALLGFLSLVITMVRNRSNAARLQMTTDELTAINEMSLTVGLYLMTIGSFLGGIWANESWGRYWGWDPKETWSLITIILYAFVLHMRMIPGLKGGLAFNTASVITFGSVIMTYLGVNYYLAGLHSYAGGDPVPVPAFVYYSAAVILLVIVAARWNASRIQPPEFKTDDV